MTNLEKQKIAKAEAEAWTNLQKVELEQAQILNLRGVGLDKAMVQISGTIAYREASARWSALNELCFNLGISTDLNEEASAIRTDFYGFTIYGRG